MGKATEGKELLQIVAWASHTPYPVGRRIASLIPPARIVPSLAFGPFGGLFGASGAPLGGLL